MNPQGARPAVAFQVGGAIRKGRAYVARSADEDLPRLLLEGEFCYVLAPRQIGKTSLKVRTFDRLEAEGVRAVDIDITAIGTREETEDEWYNGLLDEITEQLDLDADLDTFLEKSSKLTPVHRWSRFLRRVVLEELEHERVVVFIDEIDSILGHQGLSSDDFFASIRATYNQRPSDDAWERLTFCLLGVAAPTELMDDPQRTPFNIGRPIHLLDFTPCEAEQLLPALSAFSDQPEALLAEVMIWTDGHPYLTQMLCDRLGKLDGGPESVPERVQTVVNECFFRPGASLEINLQTASDRLLRARSGTPAMLSLYRRVRGGDEIAVDDRDEIHQALRLTGMVAVGLDGARSVLKPRNRIFAETFDLDWVELQEQTLRPFSEALTQWLRKDRDDDFVLRGRALEEARAWARERQDLTQEENDFLMYGLEVAKHEELAAARREERQRAAEQLLEEERRGAQRLRRLVVALFIALILAAGAAVFGWFQTTAAIKAKERARISEARARVAVAQAEQYLLQAQAAEEDKARAEEQTRQAEVARLEADGRSTEAEELRQQQQKDIEIAKEQTQERDRILKTLSTTLTADGTADPADLASLPGRIQELTRQHNEALEEQKRAVTGADQERRQTLQDLNAALGLGEKSGQTEDFKYVLTRMREIVVERNDARKEAASLRERLAKAEQSPPPPSREPSAPVTVEVEDIKCLPNGDHGVVRARVANDVPESSVRLNFRRRSAKRDYYYTQMEHDGAGRYWGVLPKTDDAVDRISRQGSPAEYFVSVFDSTGQQLARSTAQMSFVADCPVELSPREFEKAESLTVGETALWQREQKPMGWLCDGIVRRINDQGIVRTDKICLDDLAEQR